jgi:hypothetical protein
VSLKRPTRDRGKAELRLPAPLERMIGEHFAPT